MSDIFISYSRADKPVAEKLAAELTKRGYSVWWDVELLAGDKFIDVIRVALQEAKVAIVIWSSHSSRSLFVIDEARYAADHDKLIAAKTTGFEIRNIPFGFGSFHTEDVANVTQIVKAVEKLLAKTSILSASDVAVSTRSDENRLGSHSGGNVAALLSGLTLHVPEFQPSRQGLWTAVGWATTSFLAIGGIIGIFRELVPPITLRIGLDDETRAFIQGGGAICILVLGAWLVWNRYKISTQTKQEAASKLFGVYLLLLANLVGVEMTRTASAVVPGLEGTATNFTSPSPEPIAKPAPEPSVPSQRNEYIRTLKTLQTRTEELRRDKIEELRRARLALAEARREAAIRQRLEPKFLSKAPPPKLASNRIEYPQEQAKLNDQLDAAVAEELARLKSEPISKEPITTVELSAPQFSAVSTRVSIPQPLRLLPIAFCFGLMSLLVWRRFERSR